LTVDKQRKEKKKKEIFGGKETLMFKHVHSKNTCNQSRNIEGLSNKNHRIACGKQMRRVEYFVDRPRKIYWGNE